MIANEKKQVSKGGSSKPKAREETPELEWEIRQGLLDAIDRTTFLGSMTITDVSRIMPNWRSSDLAAIRAGQLKMFGTTKLTSGAAGLGIKAKCFFIPAEPKKPLADALNPLYRSLRLAGEACEKALGDVGRRTYPLAYMSCDTAGTTCYLAVEAIRRNPHYWHREAEDFVLSLVSASRLLERISSPSATIRAAISRLSDACDDLEAFADRAPSIRPASTLAATGALAS